MMPHADPGPSIACSFNDSSMSYPTHRINAKFIFWKFRQGSFKARERENNSGLTSLPKSKAFMRTASVMPSRLPGWVSSHSSISSCDGGGPCGRALLMLILAWTARPSRVSEVKIRHDHAARHCMRRRETLIRIKVSSHVRGVGDPCLPG